MAGEVVDRQEVVAECGCTDGVGCDALRPRCECHLSMVCYGAGLTRSGEG